MSASQSTRSGLKVLEPGEILFNEGDHSDSLFIIQKGQVRLYKPKGKGFVELTVLRTGEVIGEMAYFDEDGQGRKRSCSASALTRVEVIEISFTAFGKSMQSLNPWFKTIINTVVSRLRKTNSRVRELEDGQVTNYGKASNYEFLRPIEVMRILGTLFLVFKAHGESKGEEWSVSKRTLTLYTQDMYQIMEVKLESILNILGELGWLDVRGEDIVLRDLVRLRQIFIYYNSERQLEDKKRLDVSEKSMEIMRRMLEGGEAHLHPAAPQKKSEDGAQKFTTFYDLTEIMRDLSLKTVEVDGANVGLFGELTFHDGKTMIEIDFPKLQKLFSVIEFRTAVKKLNAQKAGQY